MSQLKHLSDFKSSLAAGDYEGALAAIALFEAGYGAAATTRDINDFIPSLIPEGHWRRLFLYWKGYCLNRLNRKAEAATALESLVGDYAPFPEGQNLVGGAHAHRRRDALCELAIALQGLGRREEFMALLAEIVADDPR